MKTTPSTGFSAGAPMSMVNPSTDALMTKIDSRYSLVVLAAKRARQFLVGSPIRTQQGLSVKDVTNALEEILEGKVTYAVGSDELPEEEQEYLFETGDLPDEQGIVDEDVSPESDLASTAEDADEQIADNQEDVTGYENATETDENYDDVSDFVVDARRPSTGSKQ